MQAGHKTQPSGDSEEVFQSASCSCRTLKPHAEKIWKQPLTTASGSLRRDGHCADDASVLVIIMLAAVHILYIALCVGRGRNLVILCFNREGILESVIQRILLVSQRCFFSNLWYKAEPKFHVHGTRPVAFVQKYYW